MKTIEELGISPAPWKVRDGNTEVMSGAQFVHYTGNDTDEELANARLIAAAPELYEALREAIIEECSYCAHFNPKDLSCHKDNDDNCFASKWRDALVKAGGEEGERNA